MSTQEQLMEAENKLNSVIELLFEIGLNIGDAQAAIIRSKMQEAGLAEFWDSPKYPGKKEGKIL